MTLQDLWARIKKLILAHFKWEMACLPILDEAEIHKQILRGIFDDESHELDKNSPLRYPEDIPNIPNAYAQSERHKQENTRSRLHIVLLKGFALARLPGGHKAFISEIWDAEYVFKGQKNDELLDNALPGPSNSKNLRWLFLHENLIEYLRKLKRMTYSISPLTSQNPKERTEEPELFVNLLVTALLVASIDDPGWYHEVQGFVKELRYDVDIRDKQNVRKVQEIFERAENRLKALDEKEREYEVLMSLFSKFESMIKDEFWNFDPLTSKSPPVVIQID